MVIKALDPDHEMNADPQPCLRDDELRDVDAVAEQVGDGPFDVFDGAVRVAFDEDLLEAGGHHVGHHGAVVTTHCLDALAVHLDVGVP